MGNTQGKGKVHNSEKYFNYFVLSFWYFFRILFLILIVFMVLFLWTEDFYDYTQWDLPLGLQLIGFLGLMVGMALLFFKPKYSGWTILSSSLFFWVVTAIFRNHFWLGWFYLFFPLSGILLIILLKIQQLNTILSVKRKAK